MKFGQILKNMAEDAGKILLGTPEEREARKKKEAELKQLKEEAYQRGLVEGEVKKAHLKGLQASGYHDLLDKHKEHKHAKKRRHYHERRRHYDDEPRHDPDDGFSGLGRINQLQGHNQPRDEERGMFDSPPPRLMDVLEATRYKR